MVGPDGFARELTASQKLEALTPGAYTIAASLVNAGDDGYAPTPGVQTVNVPASAAAATVSIAYVLAIGQLAVTISGIPAGAAADVDVSGPGFSQTITHGTTLTRLAPGMYTVTAASVTTGGALYNPSPRSQRITVDVTTPSSASVSYAKSMSGVFNLSIDGMYVVQSTQTYAGAIPLVERREGLLRVFVLANQPNSARPAVRVRLYQNGVLRSTSLIPATASSVPTSIDEGDLGSSWNLVIPADQLRSGLTIRADVDPDATVAEGNEEDNVFPASGTAAAFAIRSAPVLRLRFVPIYQSSNERLGQVNLGNRDQFLSVARRIHPIVDVTSDVHDVYTTSAAPLDRSDDNAWNQVLSEVNALRLAESDAADRHYYGVVSTSYTSGIAGLGYVAGRSAVGWDYLPSGASVAAHELGHNWGRYHAPCGDVSRPDSRYPYPGGSIGVYGFDFGTETVKPPSYTDLMGYCGAQWISDYTYLGVMNYRETDPSVTDKAVTTAGPGLLVWGRIVEGEPVLEPVFQVVAPPSLPAHPGPYSVEGQAAGGSTMFALSFTPDEVVDGSRQAQHFAFVVPLSKARAAGLTRLRVSGRNRVVTVVSAAPRGTRFRVGAAPGEAALRRLAGSRVALHWDAATHPMVMVRDPATGQVVAFARGGDAQVVARDDELELVASDRLHSESLRAKVAP